MGIITKLWKTTTEYSLTSKVVVTHDFQRNSSFVWTYGGCREQKH